MNHIKIGGKFDASAISLGCMRMSDLDEMKVDGSLSRLGVDYVDTLLLHRPDTLMEPESQGFMFNKIDKMRGIGLIY